MLLIFEALFIQMQTKFVHQFENLEQFDVNHKVPYT
jgi:hypothetical protein